MDDASGTDDPLFGDAGAHPDGDGFTDVHVPCDVTAGLQAAECTNPGVMPDGDPAIDKCMCADIGIGPDYRTGIDEYTFADGRKA